MVHRTYYVGGVAYARYYRPNPQQIVQLGDKEIYRYKDLKVTFVKGKVTDIE